MLLTSLSQISTQESLWEGIQKEKLSLFLRLKKAIKPDVTKKLLESCKPWGGPFTRVKEFEYILGNVILCQDTQIREVI